MISKDKPRTPPPSSASRRGSWPGIAGVKRQLFVPEVSTDDKVYDLPVEQKRSERFTGAVAHKSQRGWMEMRSMCSSSAKAKADTWLLMEISRKTPHFM